MRISFLNFILFSCFIFSGSYVILDSCPSGCECFERNMIVECKEAHLNEIPQFKFAAEVKRLVLKGNVIEKINNDDLKRYSNIEHLDLSDNEITTLSDQVFSTNGQLKEINFALNPFLCDCNLKNFSGLLHSFKNNGAVLIRDIEMMQCAGPRVLIGKPLLDVVFKSDLNIKKGKSGKIVEKQQRGVVTCPTLPVVAQSQFQKMTAKEPSTKNEEKIVPRNIALIVASIMAAVLVTAVAIATAIKHFIKKFGLKQYSWKFHGNQKTSKNRGTFEDEIKKQRRVSRGYAASDCSSDEALKTMKTNNTVAETNTTYFKTQLKNQRRQSQGYTRMHATQSLSDLEDIVLE